MATLDILAPEIFDYEKTYRNFCEAIGCQGGHILIECSFNQWYGNEIFYFESRKKLEKRLSCKVNENRKICGFCEECETCVWIQHNASFQPIHWKVYFSAVHSLKNFKIEIARTREGTTIN